jgi:hypothetical protein
MSQQQDRPKYAFVSEPEYPDGGKVKQRIKLSFKVDQLEAMKQFVTEKGNVNATVVILHEGFPFLDVYNPADADKFKKSNGGNRQGGFQKKPYNSRPMHNEDSESLPF